MSTFHHLFLLCMLIVGGGFSFPAQAAAAEGSQEVRITWGQAWSPDSTVRANGKVTFSFPSPMVESDVVNKDGTTSPIRWSPDLAGKWIWKSQTEGRFEIGEAVTPSTAYEVRMRRGMKNLKGDPLDSSRVLETRNSAPFRVSVESAGGLIGKRPSVGLTFTYPVLAPQLADVVFFQDRDSRKKHSVEVDVGEDELKTKRLRVSPREDLPMERTFDLIVENVKEANTGARFEGLEVFPVGRTDPLCVIKVWAENPALEEQRIHVEFNEPVSASEGGRFIFSPPVRGLRFHAEDKVLTAVGPFDATTRYRVEIPAALKGERGYPMSADSRWGASFTRKKSAVLFPETHELHWGKLKFGEHAVQRRAQTGLQFPFTQINTGPLKWRLAGVPAEKLAAVSRRWMEFDAPWKDPVTGKPVPDPRTGAPLRTPTDLLIEASHLPVLAEGNFDASFEDKAVYREVSWSPEGRPPLGPCLLEISGTNSEGRIIGNRTLINFREFAVLQKGIGGLHMIRILDFENGNPLAGAKVRLVSSENQWMEEQTTDGEGVARFRAPNLPWKADAPEPSHFLIDTPQGPAFEPLRKFYWFRRTAKEGAEPGEEEVRMKLITDRPLVRPGQTVHFKGFARIPESLGSTLVVAAQRGVQWSIESASQPDTPLLTGETTTDDFGGFDGVWDVPATLSPGAYMLQARLSTRPGEMFSTPIRIEEFRAPPFTVEINAVEKEGTVAGLWIQSHLFHGAPNARARVRWTATWKSIQRLRDFEGFGNAEEKTQGESVLGEDGRLWIETGNPFKGDPARGWFRVEWMVDVLGADGQTISDTALTRIHASPALLACSAHSASKKAVHVQVDSWVPGGEKPAQGTPVEIELRREFQKTVREKIGAHVFRTLQTDAWEKVATIRATTPFVQNIPVPGAGSYRVHVRTPQDSSVPEATDSTTLTGLEGDEPAEFWQPNPHVFELESEKPRYAIGDTAVLVAKAPFMGKAWVSLECNNTVVDAFATSLPHNAARIEIPIKKEYFPNVVASVHLLNPGGKQGLPSERIGHVELTVDNAEVNLQVGSDLESREVEPGHMVRGTLTIQSERGPVQDADVTLYAVDDALLVAGGWRMPALAESLYTRRPWGVSTSMPDLFRLAQGIPKNAAMQKGFIVGDGDDTAGSGGKGKPPRKNFLPLATWQTGLRTGADGKLAFSFQAPDSLTRYRIVALAQTRASAFGVCSDTVEVNKKVQIEPALPRFVRNGDALEVRAIVRQKMADSLDVTVRYSGSLKTTGGSSQTQTVRRNEPAVYRFFTTVEDESSATIRLETDAGPGDSVEMRVPVHPETLLRHESVFHVLREGTVENAASSAIPARWDRAKGEVSVSLSSSPWFAKLCALPRVLEYPHGCSEQIASRILGYTLLGELIEYLPDNGVREASYRERVQKGLTHFDAILLADGNLPYWPGLVSSSRFSTILGCWAVQNARHKGWEVSERLEQSLSKAALEIALGKDASASPFHRCFALFVASQGEGTRQQLEPVARDLFAKRAQYPDEARAFLAVSLFRMGVLESQREQLLREIDRPLEAVTFDPDTFTSTSRVEAIRAWAFATLHPQDQTGKAREGMMQRISELLETSVSLSTQENFWLLLAFHELHKQVNHGANKLASILPKPDAISRNAQSVAWHKIPIQGIRQFSPGVRPASGGVLGLLWESEFRMQSKEDDDRLDRGLRLERVVVNRTDAGRVGTREAPYKLGDELVITFRLNSPKRHHYVALESELPGCFESVNAAVPSVARSFRMPVMKDEMLLDLSFSELRDRSVCLYFDMVNPGIGASSTVVRVTSVGTFTWPASQITPMYDSRFSGLSAGSVCHVVE